MRKIGRSHLFHSKDEAIAGVFARLDRQTCMQCEARIFQECGTVPGPFSGGVLLITPT